MTSDKQTFLAVKLTELLERRKMSWTKLAEKTGISQGQLQKFKDSKQTKVSDEQRQSLSDALCINELERAELIAAICQDQCYGPGSRCVHIIVGRTAPEVSPLAVLNISPKLERDLIELATICQTNVGAAEIVSSMAKMGREAKS